MKIALVVQGLHKRGGTERAMAELAEWLAGRGHAITVFAHERDVTLLPQATWHHVPLIRRPSLARYLSFGFMSAVMRAAAHVRGERFDIVHSTGADMLHPTVTTLHCCASGMARTVWEGAEGPGWQRWSGLRRLANTAAYRLIGVFERRVVNAWAGEVIVTSQALADEVEEHYGLGARRSKVVPYGVDAAHFVPLCRDEIHEVRVMIGAPVEGPMVIFVGYNWERKGLPTLVDALAHLAEGPGVSRPHLVVVGGRGRPDYEIEVTERLGGRVSLLGTRTDVAKLLGAADVCVLPTREEPFGLPILEAMACGIPTIVSRCAGVAELITNGVDGLLLDDPRSVTELADQLAMLLESAEKRREIGARARETSLRYSWAQMAESTEAIYEEIVSRRLRSP